MSNESHIFRDCDLVGLACVYIRTTVVKTKESVSPKHLLVCLGHPSSFLLLCFLLYFLFLKIKECINYICVILWGGVGHSQHGTCGARA